MTAPSGARYADELMASLICEQAPGATLRLHKFRVAGRMQRRATGAAIEGVVSSAKRHKEVDGTPFWDAVFSGITHAPDEVQRELLGHAAYHHDMSRVAIPFDIVATQPDELLRRITQTAASLEDDEILAMSSRLLLSRGDELHIPMLDYRIPVTAENTELVVSQLATVGLRGWLLTSGRSYHFVGRELLKGARDLERFLGTALLFAPLVDGRWIAHQLIEGACSLRVSPGGPGQIPPRIVKLVE